MFIKINNFFYHAFSILLPFIILFGGYDLSRLINFGISFRIVFLLVFFVPMLIYVYKAFFDYNFNFHMANIYILLYILLYILFGLFIVSSSSFIDLAFMQFIYFIIALIVVKVLVTHGKFFFERYIFYTLTIFSLLNFLIFGVYMFVLTIFIPGMTRYNEYYIISDFWGRYQFLYSEPSYASYAIGIFTLILLYELKTKVKYMIASVLIISLFYTQAKFGFIAFLLSLFIAYFIKRIRLKSDSKFKVILLLLFFLTLILLPYFFQDLFFEIIEKKIDYDQTGTYVTRIGLFFVALKHLIYYPLGSGFGGFVLTSNELILDLINNLSNLDTKELYLMSLSGFNSSESIGYISFIFGIPGLIFLMYFLINFMTKSSDYFLLSLTLFFIISNITYINFFQISISQYALAYILFKQSKGITV